MLLTVEELLEKNIVTLHELLKKQQHAIENFDWESANGLMPESDAYDLIYMEMNMASIKEAIREKESEVSFEVLNINIILN